MNTTGTEPLSREYLQRVMEEGDEERVRPDIDKFIKLIRNECIKCAMDGNSSVTTSIPSNFKRYKNTLNKLLQDNFPGCNIVIDFNDWLSIGWTEPTVYIQNTQNTTS